MPDYSKMSLRDVFRLDARERVQALGDDLLKLESRPHDDSLFDDAMREAHSLKASARVVDCLDAQELAHQIEALLEGAKRRGRGLQPPDADLLLRASDAILDVALAFVESSEHHVPVDELLASLQAAREGSAAVDGVPAPAPGQQNKVIPAPGEPPSPSPPAGPPPGEPPSPSPPAGLPPGASAPGEPPSPSPPAGLPPAESTTRQRTEGPSVRIATDKLDRLMKLSGEIYTTALQIRRQHVGCSVLASRLAGLAAHVDRLPVPHAAAAPPGTPFSDWLDDARTYVAGLEETARQLAVRTETLDTTLRFLAEDLQDQVMGSRMLPVAGLLEAQARLVRDLARESGKRIRLDVVCGDAELDRDVLERLDSPLKHLVRNACDHGIEPPEERISAGKPSEGVVTLSATLEGDRVELVVQDDGRGIDAGKVLAIARQRGVLPGERLEAMKPAAILDLLFLPGFSTAKSVTRISGRGVGLDVVRTTVEQVMGSVRIESEPGTHTRFVLSIPTTMLLLPSLLAEVGGEVFCFPLAELAGVGAMDDARLSTVEGRPVVKRRGAFLPLVDLADIWDMPRAPGVQAGRYLLFAGTSDAVVALRVDAFLGERSVVSSPLDPRLGRVVDLSGGTVLDDGRAAFIVDVDSLIRSVADLTGRSALSRSEEARLKRRKRILLAEDSLTVRELEKKILETNGYDVVAAVDGMDALERARRQRFDLLLTDVDMPRMNGLELIRRFKKDKKLANIPTIIVSYHESEADKRRGMEVGADSYIAKSQYDNAVLLETVASLLEEDQT